MGGVQDADYPAFSTGSIDAALASVESGADDVQDNLWSNVLKDRIEEIIDWKRSSIQGREAALNAYVQLLTRRFCEHEIQGQESQLTVSFLRSIKVEESGKEMILAMKGELGCINFSRVELTSCSTCLDVDNVATGEHLRVCGVESQRRNHALPLTRCQN